MQTMVQGGMAGYFDAEDAPRPMCLSSAMWRRPTACRLAPCRLLQLLGGETPLLHNIIHAVGLALALLDS